jgi:hypothetical protein
MMFSEKSIILNRSLSLVVGPGGEAKDLRLGGEELSQNRFGKFDQGKRNREVPRP